jgi:hypothetical protein
MRGLLAAVLLAVAASQPATAQELWGTILVPGGVPATRIVMDLGGDAGRVDEFLLVDFAHRVHGTPGQRDTSSTFARYVTLLDRITTETLAWPSGFMLPTAATPKPDRDRAKHFLALLGLVLENNQRVSVGRSGDARERQAWLLAAGVDTPALVEPLNAGATVTVTIPQGELPLPLPQFWNSINTKQSPLLTIIGSRESAFLYSGLLQLDSQTLAYFGARPALLSQIRARHAESFAAVAAALRVHDGRVPDDQSLLRRPTPAVQAASDETVTLIATLDRLGITDRDLIAKAVKAVRNLRNKGRDHMHPPVARWQMMLALVEQVAVRQRLAPTRTTPLVRSLVEWAGSADANAEGRAAAWLVDVLLPAIAPTVSTEDLEIYERDVIVALVKRPIGDGAPPAVKVFWEGLDYIVDDTFAATRDVLTIRMSQHSPALGDVVRLHRVVQRLESGAPDLAQAEAIAADLTRVLAAMSKLRAPDERELKILSEFRKAERSVRDISSERDAGRATTQLPRLRAALDALVDGAVLPLLYALAVSPSGPSPSTLLEMPYWHTWEDATWLPAQREVGQFMETVIRGSVLGLDISMADTRLRAAGKVDGSIRTAAMAQDVRKSILHTMRIHGEMPSWGTDSTRILKALADGTTEITNSGDIPPTTETRFIDAGIDPARIAIVRWQRTRGVPADRQAFTRLDAYRLGTTEPLPPEWADAGVTTEVLLRLLEVSRDLRLPAGIVPTLLPLATHDWLTQVRQYGDDDMRSVQDWPRTITRERVEAYMLGLVSARMLVRPPRSPEK